MNRSTRQNCALTVTPRGQTTGRYQVQSAQSAARTKAADRLLLRRTSLLARVCLRNPRRQTRPDRDAADKLRPPPPHNSTRIGPSSPSPPSRASGTSSSRPLSLRCVAFSLLEEGGTTLTATRANTDVAAAQGWQQSLLDEGPAAEGTSFRPLDGNVGRLPRRRPRRQRLRRQKISRL